MPVGALLERGEDRAAVVVDHHDGQVGALLVRPEHAARCCRAGTSRRRAARSPGCCAAGRARHRRRWTPSRRCRRGPGCRPPSAGRPRRTARPSGRGRAPGWTPRRRAARPVGPRRSPPPRRGAGSARRAAASSASRRPGQVRVPGAATPRPGGLGRRPSLANQLVDALELDPVDRCTWCPGRTSPDGPRDRVHLDVVAGQQPVHRPRQGRVPEDHDLLDPAGQVLVAEQQPVGADRRVAGARRRWSARRAAASRRPRRAPAPADPRRRRPPRPCAGRRLTGSGVRRPAGRRESSRGSPSGRAVERAPPAVAGARGPAAPRTGR